jgi:hypothetical protein
VKQLFAIIAAVGVVGSVGFNPWGIDDGIGGDYWQFHSLVYGRVEQVNEVDKVVFRPLGVISGHFDVGTVQRLPLKFNIAQIAPKFPSAGDHVMAVLFDDGASGYVMPYSIVKYFPGSGESFGFVRVKDLSDPVVGETIKAVQKLRKEDARLPAAEPRWTAALSILYADIVRIERPDPDSDDVVLQPRKVLAGNPGPIPAGELILGTRFKLFPASFRPPAGGAKVIVGLATISGQGPPRCALPAKFDDFMPGDHSSICEVTGPDDPKIAEAVTAFRGLSFWESHSLIYAEVFETRSPKDDKSPGTIVFRSKLRGHRKITSVFVDTWIILGGLCS